mmetsp:Transcript_31269/g.27504  ORF Transcript_31269/g.27504 Transcript_31269/m.27504 type:complete len:117 (+) Transcript_31269:100-450(+)
MKCYGEYDDTGAQCAGQCNLGENGECGVCSMVICMGDLNDAENINAGLYGMGALDIWERALLLASVVILGCVCCWGLCYLLCNGSNSMMHRALVNNDNDMNMIQVESNDDTDELSN